MAAKFLIFGPSTSAASTLTLRPITLLARLDTLREDAYLRFSVMAKKYGLAFPVKKFYTLENPSLASAILLQLELKYMSRIITSASPD